MKIYMYIVKEAHFKTEMLAYNLNLIKIAYNVISNLDSAGKARKYRIYDINNAL